mmetsp:Transcript_45272/g.135118  ORF Transcript_45272/g.135118 Transcript_45272/m.135118 type:complete len:263 (+) Transcript_45272:1039-1827(+)
MRHDAWTQRLHQTPRVTAPQRHALSRGQRKVIGAREQLHRKCAVAQLAQHVRPVHLCRLCRRPRARLDRPHHAWGLPHLFLRPRCVGAVDVHCEQAGGRRLGFALSCERLHKLRAGLGPQHARRRHGVRRLVCRYRRHRRRQAASAVDPRAAACGRHTRRRVRVPAWLCEPRRRPRPRRRHACGRSCRRGWRASASRRRPHAGRPARAARLQRRRAVHRSTMARGVVRRAALQAARREAASAQRLHHGDRPPGTRTRLRHRV